MPAPTAGMPSLSIEITDTRKFSKARPLAKRLGVGSRTLRRWGAEGKFPRYVVNDRVVLFDPAEVIRFVESTRAPISG